jgi:hypothetical protein
LQNGDAMQKNSCGVIDTACKIWQSTSNSSSPGSLKREYLSKHVCSRIVLPHHYKNLKGHPNEKFSCMRCHWHRMHDCCVRKSSISRRIRSRIRGPGCIVWWKKPRKSKISWHCLFKSTIKKSFSQFCKFNDGGSENIICHFQFFCAIRQSPYSSYRTFSWLCPFYSFQMSRMFIRASDLFAWCILHTVLLSLIHKDNRRWDAFYIYI